jgi:signal transduction histidine kinase/DNA-binding response OmpR family regulator
MKHITTTYTYTDYKAGLYNTGIAEGKDGTMFFANLKGVLHYDGKKWNLIKTATEPQELDVSASGTVYVAANEDIGYLEQDGSGSYRYVSLKARNSEKLGSCWRVLALDEVIFFQFRNYLLVYKNKVLHRLDIQTDGNISKYEDQVLIHDRENQKLLRIDQNLNVTTLYEFNEALSGLFRNSEKSLILVGKTGLYNYEKGRLKRVKSEVNEWIMKNFIWTVIELDNGSIAITSSSDGMIVISKNGELEYHLSRESGHSKNIYDIFQDSQKQLWLAIDHGIIKLNLRLGLRIVDKSYNLRLKFVDIREFEDKLFLLAMSGPIMSLDLKNSIEIPKIMDTNFNPRYSAVVNNRLFFSSPTGLYEYKNRIFKKIYNDDTNGLIESEYNKNQLYITNGNGVKLLDFSEKEPKVISTYTATGSYFDHPIIEESEGVFWILPIVDVLRRLDLNKRSYLDFKIPSTDYITKFEAKNGKIYFNLKEDDFIYDIKKKTSEIVPKSEERTKLYEKKFSHKIHPDIIKYNNLFRFDIYDIEAFSNDSSIYWLHSIDYLLRFDTNHKVKNLKIRETLINTVLLNKKKAMYLEKNELALADSIREIEFHYSYPVFDEEKRHQFQKKLEGYDNNWSDYSEETVSHYTNLKHGDYIFSVRAKDIYGNISPVTQLSFRIKTPFYYSVYAYIFYSVFILILIVLIIRFRTRQLLKKQESLENIIQERTEELQRSVKYRNDFFANISHEFRTPLTLILGPIKRLLKKSNDKDLVVASKNAKRLLHLVNQLLELTKSEYGQLELKLKYGNITRFINNLITLFDPICKEHEIRLSFDAVEEIEIYYDPDKLDKILINLISNAIKFSTNGAEILIKQEIEKDSIQLTISDTGIGIKKSLLPFIFDRFRQGEASEKRNFYGTGIGLSLVKELAECHKAKFSIESEEGKGTLCSLILSRDKSIYPVEAFNGVDNPEINWHESVDFVKAELDLIYDHEEEQAVKEGLDTILLVEDNIELRRYIASELRDLVNVYTASDGVEGLKLAEKIQPKLIISDVMMPNMDGFEFCNRIKTTIETSHIPVILLTAKSGTDDELSGLKYGADDYLTKPFNSEFLRLKVTNSIKNRDIIREKFKKNVFIKPSEITITEIDTSFLEKLNTFIFSMLKDLELDRDLIAQHMNISISTLNRKVKSLTELSISDYIRSLRLQKSVELLNKSELTVTEISYEVGFNDPSFYTRSFKKQFNKTPKEFRKTI